MSKAAKSIFIFSIYMAAAGLGFMVAPNIPLVMLGFSATNEPWIRVVGMLMVILGYYYFQASRKESEFFFRSTVHVRPFVLVCFIIFAATGLADPMIILFGVIDLLGAIWTAFALRS
ncbi:MAG: hypothetical protein CVV49_21980 [Spirochaetae bacterium HGW-Spirochaetae-5]|nr:MAG: hypothetical protein CVV49_21980 [Spirochaetae bacterium HGW-Spirochaetae-5]